MSQVQQKSVNRSTFQPRAGQSASSQPKAGGQTTGSQGKKSFKDANGNEIDTSTTHYAYVLNKNSGGETEREFVANVRIYEQASKFEDGEPFLKVQILGALPESGNIYIARKKQKD